jgi:hypothetical protein
MLAASAVSSEIWAIPVVGKAAVPPFSLQRVAKFSEGTGEATKGN